MTLRSIIVLAVGLAMDATAVAAARGLAASEIRPRHVVLIATFFGGFQALMPLIGWIAGSQIGPFVAAWDHWIAFALLAGIGAKMIWEALGAEASQPRSDDDLFAPRVLLVLAVATSIDALAAGLTLPMLNAPLVLSLATIGITTAVMSALGLFAGRRFGAALGKRLDIAGGVVLIGVAFKTLAEHLSRA
jgi:putative Mn2+ efflux pump MntP